MKTRMTYLFLFALAISTSINCMALTSDPTVPILKSLFRTNWEPDGYDKDKLEPAKIALKSAYTLRPTSLEGKKLRIELILHVLRYHKWEIANEAEKYFEKIAASETDSVTQGLLLTESDGKAPQGVKPVSWLSRNWSGRALENMVKTVAAMKINDPVLKLDRINFLATVRDEAYDVNMKDAAAAGLKAVAAGDISLESEQEHLVKAIRSIDWGKRIEYDRSKDNLIIIVSILDSIRPASQNIQKLRVEAIHRAMKADDSRVRRAAEKTLLNVLVAAEDDFTKSLILDLVISDRKYNSSTEDLPLDAFINMSSNSPELKAKRFDYLMEVSQQAKSTATRVKAAHAVHRLIEELSSPTSGSHPEKCSALFAG